MIKMIFLILLCGILTVNAYAGCQQLIVAPESESPDSNWTITDYTFQYNEGNSTYKICGPVAYSVTSSPLAMWLELTVTDAPVVLEIYAKLNYTDTQGNVTSYYLTHTQYYDIGNSPVHLISEDNYRVGTYNVVEVSARKSS